MIGIVNYSAGNAVSVFNALKREGIESFISSDERELAECRKFILPGIGSFDYAIKSLRKSGLSELLTKKVLIEKTPCLGICLGMQLMTALSDEGSEKGLGWLEAETIKLNSGNGIAKLPHIGWKPVKPCRPSLLLSEIGEEDEFYFSHSYHVLCSNDSIVAGVTMYHTPFVSVIEAGHIAGVQFHPEKSHSNGLKVLKNFAEKF